MKLKIQILRDNGQSKWKWERASDKNIGGKLICEGNVFFTDSMYCVDKDKLQNCSCNQFE